MATELAQQQGMWLMPIVPSNLHTKYELDTTLDKEVIGVSLWLPWQLNSIAARYVDDTYRPQETSYQI